MTEAAARARLTPAAARFACPVWRPCWRTIPGYELTD